MTFYPFSAISNQLREVRVVEKKRIVYGKRSLAFFMILFISNFL